MLELTFADGSMGQVDLAPVIVGKGCEFKALNDPKVFAQVRVDADVLYEEAHRA